MKKWFLNMLVVGVLGALAVSCSDEYDELGLDSRKAQVMFSVAMDTPSARSRATWEDNQNSTSALIGDDFDNKIDLNQLTVKIEAGGKTYNVVNPIKWKVEGTKNEYKIVGIVDGIDQNTRLTDPKFTVYANMDEEQETFDATYSAETPNGVQSIPMWGVMTYEGTLNFDLGKRVDIGNIYLLRAMAKIEVALNEEMNGEYDLVGATLNKYNGTGNCLPNDNALQADHTTSLELEEVFNPNASSKQDLIFNKVGNSYVVYLPEVAKGTSEAESLNIEVALRAKGASEESEPETGNFKFMDYATNPEAPTAIDIVRNHWYKYTISGFSASEVQVNYQTVDWQPINIEVGGEGFLFLNKDVIEIYNSNIDADQLKFSSSSPIKSIELKDLYKHYRNGEIKETPVGEETDAVYAYYMDKFGVLTQLSSEEGNDEAVVLANISAGVKEENKEVLNGGIVINSPFINHETLGDSHYNTIRYLEFEVENEQGLKATFRVMQYPPVVITNEEGFFSYRDDFRIDVPYKYDQSQFTDPNTQREPVDNGEPVHFLNPIPPFFCLAGFFPYHEHEWDPIKGGFIPNPKSCGSYIGFDETPAGLYERDHMRVDAYKGSPVTGVFHRTHYTWNDGSAFIQSNPSQVSSYYQNVGPVYEKKDQTTGEIIGQFRRHYTGNSFNFFYSKFVNHVYTEDGINSNGDIRIKGEADICSMLPNDNYDGWDIWSVYSGNKNHRMYHICTTTTSSEYTIGWPTLETIDGRTYTAEDERNSRMVSPSFMVASQLGSTNVPQNRDHYDVPKEEGMYIFARRQCEQYVEAVYEDIHNDGYTAGVDSVTHYSDWRLPTEAEVKLIVEYQRKSRVMDKVLAGESYFYTSKVRNDYKVDNILYKLDPVLDEPSQTGYHMRCVRDVKPDQQLFTKIYPENK